MSTGAAGSLSATLDSASRDIRRILAGVLDGHELSVDDGIALTGAAGRDLHAITLVADEMRRRQVGDVVTYVVNRNINFTNVCIKHCGFCAFSRDHREEEGYLLPVDEVVRRAREAWELGATEVCIQAGLPPKLDGHYYIDLTRAIKRALPGIHMHAFSPEEVLYGSVRSGLPIKEYLAELKAAGLGTLPGTSAEILDQEIRDRISRGRITVDQCVEVVKMHALARLMLGATLRNIQSSWVKEGPKLAQLLLDAGANDLGGTLINESISTAAGAQYGQLLGPAELRRLVRDAGRIPAQRDTLYAIVQTYRDGEDPESPLDRIDDAEARFGSYRRLIASGEVRDTRR